MTELIRCGTELPLLFAGIEEKVHAELPHTEPKYLRDVEHSGGIDQAMGGHAPPPGAVGMMRRFQERSLMPSHPFWLEDIIRDGMGAQEPPECREDTHRIV